MITSYASIINREFCTIRPLEMIVIYPFFVLKSNPDIIISEMWTYFQTIKYGGGAGEFWFVHGVVILANVA